MTGATAGAVVAAAASGVAAVAAVVATRTRRALAESRARDVTAAVAHQQLLAKLQEALEDARLRQEVLAGLDEGVLLIDAATIIYANPKATALVGVTTGAAVPPALPFDAPGDVALHAPQHRIVSFNEIRLPDQRRIVSIRDVTDARRIEQMRRDFVGDASHELKTPVAAILATAETLETAARDDPDAVRSFSTRLVGEARRLSRLVQDLLDLARLEQLEVAGLTVSLSEVVGHEAASLTAAASAKGLRLEVAVQPDVRVMGSEHDLSLAIRNLIDNAVRYTAAGEVTVRLEASGGVATVSIADTGAGIASKDAPRIFERFYRIDDARSRDTGGTGLGLAIVKHVAERHGGSAAVDSELGRGSTFTLQIPTA